MSHAPPTGFKGGLLLAWHSDVNLACFLTTDNMINAWCYSDPPDKPWLLSCIYGPTYRENKCDFWDSISKIGEYYNGA
jgi:hypothetical protein